MMHCTLSLVLTPQVADVQQMLTAWDHSVRNYRHQHLWLLFCSVPKQLLLFQMIEDFTVDTQDEVAQQLVREVMFLVKNDPTVRDELKQNILVRKTRLSIAKISISLYSELYGYTSINLPVAFRMYVYIRLTLKSSHLTYLATNSLYSRVA